MIVSLSSPLDRQWLALFQAVFAWSRLIRWRRPIMVYNDMAFSFGEVPDATPIIANDRHQTGGAI